MAAETIHIIKISVRTLVEFMLRSGDLEESGGIGGTEAMREGSRLHKKIQKRMGHEYQAEVPLSILMDYHREDCHFKVLLEGRADGIIDIEGQPVIIDEIKTTYMDLSYIQEAIPMHQYQAMCYGYMYGAEHGQADVTIRLTYCHLETEEIKTIDKEMTFAEVAQWFEDLMDQYGKWAEWQYKWMLERNASCVSVEFPFTYRHGQRELAAHVYKVMQDEKKLFIQAPTGVGKTISTGFPAVKTMGHGNTEKIFYLTAKTIARTVAEDTFRIMGKRGLMVKVITLTAKDKICILPKAACSPHTCQRAKGHYDRVNEAIFDTITHENHMTRDTIEAYAHKHQVCPFEMSLDVSLWSDVIICDYNYVFDPHVYLKRFFVGEKKNNYVLLVDEAHNLPDRAREMVSAELYHRDMTRTGKSVAEFSKKLERRLKACAKTLTSYGKNADGLRVLGDVSELVRELYGSVEEYENMVQEHRNMTDFDEVLQFYFALRHFLFVYEILDEKYMIYVNKEGREGLFIKLLCIDPSNYLQMCLKKVKSAVFFSGTLLPVGYYKEQLGGTEEDHAVYAASPFEEKKRLVLIGGSVSTKYTRRNETEYKRILEYIMCFVTGKVGNYMVFFPSYQYMNEVLSILESEFAECIINNPFDTNLDDMEDNFGRIELKINKRLMMISIQGSKMNEQHRESYLQDFVEQPQDIHVGFCIMGSIFSEGIDLKGDRLIGAVVVGTGLPMVSSERELFKSYYESRDLSGFDYAYLFQGMNKVMQSAGRVIRTLEDKGAVLLLDERFTTKQYKGLFPREWHSCKVVNCHTMKEELARFWNHEGTEVIE